MKRPWRTVTQAEERPSPDLSYMDTEAYRAQFIRRCADKGLALRTEDEIDLGIAAGKVFRMGKGARMRLFLECGHRVDVGYKRRYARRVRCHICQSKHNGEMRRAKRRLSWA